MMRPRVAIGVWLAATLAPGAVSGATLQPATVQAWNAYVAATEARIDRELSSSCGFLVADFAADAAAARARIGRGEVLVTEMPAAERGGARLSVPDGLVSHWRGAIFLRDITLSTLL